MQFNETFKKIPWVYEMSEVYANGVLIVKRLDQISEEAQKKLIFSVVTTLAQYFGGMHHYVDGLSLSDSDYEKKCQIALSRILPIWLSGLCDVSMAQIISALVDILNLKTEYQKWPPKSVMEFHAVCKIPRPAYHDVPPAPSNALRLGWNKDYARAKTEKVAYKCLSEIFARFGKDYEQIRQEKIEKDVYGEQFKSGNGELKEV